MRVLTVHSPREGALLAMLVLGAAVAPAPGTVSSFAGQAGGGYAGDGSAATAASVRSPAAIAVDSAGNVYFADAVSRPSRGRMKEGCSPEGGRAHAGHNFLQVP